MLGEIVPAARNSGQLGAYMGPHVAELETFEAPGDLDATYARLADSFRLAWRLERLVFQDYTAFQLLPVSAFTRMQI